MLRSMRRWLDGSERKIKKMLAIADRIDALEADYTALSDGELCAKTGEFRQRMEAGESLDSLLPESFAVVREASKRTLGLRHFRVQLVGGMVLHQGDISEMKTGEGKTLVATLPAYLNALSQKGVHVVTVNDYLAQRDRETVGRIYEFLGLTTGLNLAHMPPDMKREAYKADITFGTNNEYGFDYLRDNMILHKEQLTQRDLHYAIIDEVDSILVDEARTPLIISGQATKATDLYYMANRVVLSLDKKKDYSVDVKTKQVSLSESGVERVEKALGIDNLYDLRHVTVNHHIQQALKAHVLMKRDTDYVVNEEGVLIVDEFTGRLMRGRRYSDGLHQAIEAKENLQVQHESMTLATVTLQNFFRLYDKLCGMTGTAKTEEEEFRKIYKMRVLQVPTHRPMIRVDLPDILYRGANAKFRAVVQEIVHRHEKGQPVLVGTVSIENSERLSAMIAKHGIRHEVLNAKNHAREAEIIAQAGQRGAVTIATNMAGRGTDIVLGEGVSDLGGLHIIGTERHESRRIDNQLRGRSGRQGDPGSSRFFLSFSDDLMRRFASEKTEKLVEKLGMEEDQPLESKMFTRAVERAQKRVEGNNFDARRWVLQYDNVLSQQREILYKQRRQVLTQDNLDGVFQGMAKAVVERTVRAHTADELTEMWDLGAIRDFMESHLLPEGRVKLEDLQGKEPADMEAWLLERVMAYYHERQEALGKDQMHDLTRSVLLRIVDRKWTDHIDAMEHLRQGVHLRAYGQENPLRSYQMEGFSMFEQVIWEIQVESVKHVCKTVIVKEGESTRGEEESTEPDFDFLERMLREAGRVGIGGETKAVGPVPPEERSQPGDEGDVVSRGLQIEEEKKQRRERDGDGE